MARDQISTRAYRTYVPSNSLLVFQAVQLNLLNLLKLDVIHRCCCCFCSWYNTYTCTARDPANRRSSGGAVFARVILPRHGREKQVD